MDKKIMSSVLAARKDRLRFAETEIEMIKEKAFSYPDISASQRKFSDSVFEDLKNGGNGKSQAVMSAKSAYASSLHAHGFDESMFVVAIECGKCHDTGVYNGKLCECVWKEYISALKADCDLSARAPFTFADCKLDVVANETQREELSALYDLLFAYANKYPNITKYNLVLSGGTGTGKTCLASAVANKMLDRGQSVQFLSAYEFNTTMLSCHTSQIAARDAILYKILNCDLLVIDDLGTEPMLRNVTVEYLLLALSERFISKHATLITTNLTFDRILEIYGERIYSRLADKRHSLCIELRGKDLRR
ncbi:MAG: ATP-binding protein [Clostridia bacterium]